MEEKNDFQFYTGMIGYPLLFVLVIWLVFWFEIRFGFDFNHWGIYPRSFEGLRGVLFGPFIHADMKHLANNSLPLLILTTALLFFYRQNALKILVYGLLLTGVLTWLMGRPANHIGASGVIYMLFGFLFFKGILAKHLRLIALSFSVVFIYGSMLWYVFPIDRYVSWEGHLSGLITGAFLALIIRKNIAKPKKYIWETPEYNPEEDEFLKHFDENGNFIENLPEDIQEDNFQINYLYNEKQNNQEEE